MLIGIGMAMMLIGVVTYGMGRIPRIGRLPGDLFIQKGHFSFYFPAAACLILSILFTLLLNLFRK